MAYYPKNKFKVLLNPDQSVDRQKSASTIFLCMFFIHMIPLCILYGASLVPTLNFIILFANYLALAYSAGSVSLGYSDGEHTTINLPADKTLMTQLTTLFLITGIAPLIYLQCMLPALFVVYFIVPFYFMIAISTYLNFDEPNTNSTQNTGIMHDLKCFFKEKIFVKEAFSLIEHNKEISRKRVKRYKKFAANNKDFDPTTSNQMAYEERRADRPRTYGHGTVGGNNEVVEATPIISANEYTRIGSNAPSAPRLGNHEKTD
ncbi:MAG: hypothetical protein VX335_05195 [Pseudomonadota bacterium]|nr:hypothetical protein [Pseudomonadota bacterium]